MDLSNVDPTGVFAPRFSILLRCLFVVSDVPNTVLHTRFPGLGVGVLLYQFRSLVHVTERRDVAAAAFLMGVIRQGRLEQFLATVFPATSFLVHPAASADMGPRGQPASFNSRLLLARLNPDGLSHGCVVRGLRLKETLVLTLGAAGADYPLIAEEVRVLRLGISRAVRDRRLPFSCHLLFERRAPGHTQRNYGARGAPVEVGRVDIEWEHAGEDMDGPTARLISQMRPSMFWQSSRSTRYYNRNNRGWAMTPPSSTDEEE